MNTKVLKDYEEHCKNTQETPSVKGLHAFYNANKEIYKII